MHYFFTDQKENDRLILMQQDLHHALNVLRLNSGDSVKAFDGKGMVYQCTIGQINKKEGWLNIESSTKSSAAKSNFTVFIAPPKRMDRMEWFVEKATEIGIKSIVPFISSRSERKSLRIDRLERIVIGAMKQSKNPFKPQVHELVKYTEALQMETQADRFIAYCADTSIPSFLKRIQPNKPTAIFIGPEGDFTTSEIEQAKQSNIFPVDLGPNRYRTETAAILALHTHALAGLI